MNPERDSRLHVRTAVRTAVLVPMRSKRSSLRTTVWGLILTLAVLLVGYGKTQSTQAQPHDGSFHLQPIAPPNISPLSSSAALRSQRHTEPVASLPVKNSSSHFGNALVGSTIGTVVGGSLGVLMIRGANDDEFWEGQEEATSVDCCDAQQMGLALLRVAAAAGAGPYGAAQRLDQGGATFYAASVSGELLLGELGYALGSALGGDDGRVIGGLALGVPLGALGAAGGAVLEAQTTSGTRRTGRLRSHGDQWRVGMPNVRIRPGLGTNRGPIVRVTFFSAQID